MGKQDARQTAKQAARQTVKTGDPKVSARR